MSESPKKKAIIRQDELVPKMQPATNEPPADSVEPVKKPPAKPAKKPGVGQGDPKTLGELWERVKRSLYAAIDGLCGLPADIVKGAREIVQQVPKYVPELVKSFLVSPRISEAIAKRIEKGIKESDQKEMAAQVAAVKSGVSISVAQAQSNLTEILEALRAKGLHVDISDVSGVPTIIAVRPELAETASAIAKPAADVAKVEET